MPTKKDTVAALLERHGRLFSAEAGVDLSRNSPSALFRWLCFSLLASARISADIAMRAAQALADEGWTTADKLADSTWRERTDVLNRAGYARYDESTSRMLGDTVALLLDEYGGDLRKLRAHAERDAEVERKLLMQCKGIGEVGADIFFREAQIVWDEHYPFADKVALRAAAKLDLGHNGKALAAHVDAGDYPRLVAALIRAELAGDHDEILQQAS